MAFAVLFLAAGQACSTAPHSSDPERQQEPSGAAGEAVSHYEVRFPVRKAAASEPPEEPYQRQYEFDAELDWFTRHIPVWEAALEEFKGRPDLRYLEIGCYEGRSAVWMLENVLTHETSRLTCIDPYPDHIGADVKQRFLSNVELSGARDRVDLIVGYSQEELRGLPLSRFDIIYVDGDHRASAVLEDAVLSWRLLKNGGLMIFDDYGWELSRPPHERPRMGADFFYEAFRPQLDVVHRDYQLMVRKLGQ